MAKPRIALLMDDRTIALLAARALGTDFQTQAFASATGDFMAAIEAYAPQALVMRSTLAVGPASEALATLRARPPLAHVPVVVLSAAEASHQPFLASGAVVFVPVPFTAEHLRETVRRAATEQRTILYVEDSRILHKLIVPPLADAGYTVIEAFDGAEARALLETGRRIDLVLSDVEMPNLDGLRLCRIVKDDPRFSQIPFVLLTSREGDDAVEAGFSAGADDYLMKPVVVAELLSRIERFIGERPEQREERILLVEPDPHVAPMLARSLATHSLGCDIAPDASAARALLEGRRYALAIIENKLPVDDGVALVRSLRERPTTADLSIIMTTANDSLAEQVRIRSAGPQSVLAKPFPPERLLAEVERALANVRHKRQVEAMRGYLSEGAIQAIERRSSGTAEPRAEATFRSILFLDIVGFTALCESMSPLAVVRFLNDFFDAIVGILTRHGASIDKFIGDCVMALFDREQAGIQAAVAAAREILDTLPGLRDRLKIDVHVRIGINAGAMVLGDIGSSHHRRDFTVIGDHVNVAARLQTAAGIDQVFVSETVARQLVGVPLTEIGPLAVKGRREPVRAFRVD